MPRPPTSVEDKEASLYRLAERFGLSIENVRVTELATGTEYTFTHNTIEEKTGQKVRC